MSYRLMALSTLLLLCASMAGAQGVVTKGPLEFEFNADIAGATSGNADLRLDTVDQLFQYWYWYRIAGDTAETVFPVPDTQDYTGSIATLTWDDVNGDGFAAELVVDVRDCSIPGDCLATSPGGNVLTSLTLTNNSGASLDIQVFTYFDFDVAGSAAADAAALGNVFGPSIGIDDGATHVDVLTFNRDLQVTVFADIRDELNDTDVDNLDGSGLPFGPADFTAALQEQEVIPAAGVATLTEGIFLDTGILFVDGFETGDTSLWSAVVGN
ncbi:MAG: hypothetical protein AAF657_16270 [Acidobacteriota bacterium]